jgi:hypothetical protein
MKTTPRSRVRLASYPAALGWLLLFLAVHRPDSGSSWSYAHAGLIVGGGFTLLTLVAAVVAVAASPEDGEFGAAWLGGLSAVILFVWFAFQLGSFNLTGLLELGPTPEPQRDAVGHMVSFAGGIGLLTTFAAVGAIVTVQRRRRKDGQNAKSRPAGG